MSAACLWSPLLLMVGSGVGEGCERNRRCRFDVDYKWVMFGEDKRKD